MKKVITLLLAVLMIFSLAACNNDTNPTEPSTSGEPFYDMPDFSVPPTASGDSAKFTLNEIIDWVNNTEVFTFEFAETLEKSKQTLYKTEDLTDGEEVKEAVSPLGLITFAFEAADIPSLGNFEASDFTFYDDNKMAQMKESERPKEFMECVVTDVCLDLTDASLIVRAAYVVDNTNDSSTYFCTVKLTYLGDNQYKLFVRAEDYGDSNGKEYVYITEETFNFTADDYNLVEGTYQCSQKTSLVYETTLTAGESGTTTTTVVKRSEIISVDIDIKCNDGVYTVEREMIMKQSDESYDPADATEIYRVNQKIEQKDGIYVLTEVAKGADNNGDPVDLTQYVTFAPKSEA